MRLSRRPLLKHGAIAALTSLLPLVGCVSPSRVEVQETRVIVIGAGIAGLAAAQKLKNAGFQVRVIEARDRLGGRIWTDRSLGVPMDMGASWIHGPDGDNPITPLAKAAGAKMFVTDDDSVVVFDEQGQPYPDAELVAAEAEFEDLLAEIEDYSESRDRDLSILQAIRTVAPQALKDPLICYQLTAYMEFDAGGPIEDLSAWYWAADDLFPGDDVLFPDGYDAVINLLAEELEIELEQVVETIAHHDDGVTITTTTDEFTADCVVVTLPLGVLQAGTVNFSPPLPKRMARAINTVKMGGINKAVLAFPAAFWPVETQYFGYPDPEKGKYSYFLNARTFSEANALMTFGFGNYGWAMESQTDGEITADILATLAILFPEQTIPEPEGVVISCWTADPFARGAYSYAGVNATPKDFAVLGGSVGDRLFFAGEHTSPDYRGTVHGAYLSGIREADHIIDEYG